MYTVKQWAQLRGGAIRQSGAGCRPKGMLVPGPWHQEETCSEPKSTGSFHDPDRFCNPRKQIWLGSDEEGATPTTTQGRNQSAVTREDVRSSAPTSLPDTGRQEWVGVGQ